MAWTMPSYADLLAQTKADIDARFPGADSRLRRSSLTVLAHVFSGVAYPLYLFIAWVADQIIYDTAEAEWLARYATIWGVNRHEARFAAGLLLFSGNAGAAIPLGTRLVSSAGQFYLTTQAGLIADAGTALVAAEAEAPGQAGNLDSGFGLALVSPVAGVNPAVVVGGDGLAGGADAEADASLRARLLARIQLPPHGGAEHDYQAWTRAADPRISHVWVSAGAMGLGTVTVRFMMFGSRPDGIPTEDDVAQVQAYIEARRPLAMGGVYVAAPVPEPLVFELAALTPNTGLVLAEIAAQLRDLIQREAVPGGSLPLSRINEAISLAPGEQQHVLALPATAPVAPPGHIFVFGGVSVVAP